MLIYRAYFFKIILRVSVIIYREIGKINQKKNYNSKTNHNNSYVMPCIICNMDKTILQDRGKQREHAIGESHSHLATSALYNNRLGSCRGY